MKTNIKLVIPFFLIIIVLMLVVFKMDKTLRENVIKHDLERMTHQVAIIIQNELAQVNADLLYLSSQYKAKEVLLGQETADSNHLCDEYLDFSNLNKRYSQVRLIDVTGHEVVRVEQVEGKAVNLANQQLQDKSDRYYFQESERLKIGEIYQSPFDLNVEHGVVETPYKPTIRFITPVSDFDSNTIGYLALNLDAGDMINKINNRIKGQLGSFSIVNQSGGYFLSNDASKNWGFMFDKPELALSVQQPNVWQRIKEKAAGNLFSMNERFYVFQQICGKNLCDSTENGLKLATDAIDMPWTVIGELDESEMLGVSWWQSIWPYVISSLLLLVAVFALRISSKLSQSVDLLKNREVLLQRSKFRFEKLLESVPEGLIIVNSQGKIETLNPQAEKIFERTKEEAIGQSIKVFMQGAFAESHPFMSDDFFNHPQKIEVSQDQPFEYVSSSGLKKSVEVVIDPVMFEDEKLAIVLVRDVTKKIEHQDQIRQSQKLEAVGQLTGGVAHDFNNLLGIMVGNLELLELSMASDKKLSVRITKIMKAVNSASELTQKLLAVSRKKPLEVQAVNVAELMSDVLDMLHRTIRNKVEIHYSAAPNLPLIFVDPNELTNALINLAVNARDAMPEGGNIFINVENVYLDEIYTKSIVDSIEPGNYLLIDLSDTGTGIDNKIIDKVLEPFFTTKEKGKGTGLGLAMIYAFIKQSKGHMRIYSEAGRGTSIHMYLPIQERKVLGVVNQEVSDNEEHHDLSRYYVLVVDDEADLAEVAQDYLALEGMKCDIAYSGDQAWLKLMERPYDLVFSDIVMPGELDGLGLYHKIKEAELSTRVILSSGFSEEMLKIQHEVDEDFIFVRKPYKRSQVIKAVLNALGIEGGDK